MSLELRNISIRFPKAEKPLFSDLELTVPRGVSVAVCAPSGFGKSTLLSIAGLLLAPSTGEVLIDGQARTPGDAPDLLGFGGIAWVLQTARLFPARSALENVLVARLASGARREDIAQQAAELLQKVGLDPDDDRPSGTLSGGEQQRVSVARAMFAEPSVLIADEPTANLDRVTADLVAGMLFEVGKSSSVLMATHDRKVAELADHIFEPNEQGVFTLQ